LKIYAGYTTNPDLIRALAISPQREMNEQENEAVDALLTNLINDEELTDGELFAGDLEKKRASTLYTSISAKLFNIMTNHYGLVQTAQRVGWIHLGGVPTGGKIR